MLVDPRGDRFDAWYDGMLKEHQAQERIAFSVRLVADGRLVGSTSYLDVHEKHKRIEIGSTWYTPDQWQTATNPECKLLLLRHAFEVYGMNRVSLVTDLRNERSQAAIAKLGAQREGILRSHMITRGGRIRDSVVFSILSSQWPSVKARMEARLAHQLATMIHKSED
jgi:RimJ/RimL family protein N-acetyltransferase